MMTLNLNNIENMSVLQAYENVVVEQGVTPNQAKKVMPVIDFYEIGHGLKAFGSALKNSLYEQSYRLSRNEENIAALKEKYKNYTQAEKFAVGALQGAINSSILLTLLVPPVKYKKESRVPTARIISVIAYPIGMAVAEEIAFRGVLQNLVGLAQTSAIKIAPAFLQNHRTFKWTTSASAKIITTNSCFALAHYVTNPGPVGRIQAGRVLLFPIMSNLHETTGGIAAPLGAHLANNIVSSMTSAY